MKCEICNKEFPIQWKLNRHLIQNSRCSHLLAEKKAFADQLKKPLQEQIKTLQEQVEVLKGALKVSQDMKEELLSVVRTFIHDYRRS